MNPTPPYRVEKLLSLIALNTLIPACTSVESGSQIRTHRYETVYLTAEGCFRRTESQGRPQDTPVYIYSVHINSIRYFGEDERQAAEALVTNTDSTPAVCKKGVSLTKIGRLEGGGRTISVVCKSTADSTSLAVLQGPVPLCAH